MACVLDPFVFIKEMKPLSKGPIPWKGTIGRAVQGAKVSTDLLKLARLVYKAAEDNDPDTLVAAWMKKAEETVQWAISEAAGESQLADITDVPKTWVNAVTEIDNAFRLGVDMTKIPSYHQMKKVAHMLAKAEGEESEAPAVPDSEQDKALKEIAVAEKALSEARDRALAAKEAIDKQQAEAANDEAEEVVDDPDDVPIVDDPDDEADEADVPVKPAEHVEEPEQGKPAVPGKSGVSDADKLINDQDAAFVAAIIEAALKSGQVLDPDKISLTPAYLLNIVKMLEALSEGKRNQLVNGITNLVKTQYDNHVNEAAEGKKRTQTQKQKALAAEAKRIAKGHDEVIQLSDAKKKAAAAAKAKAAKPPTRTKGDADFASNFAALMGKK